jgi:hypothetical protein
MEIGSGLCFRPKHEYASCYPLLFDLPQTGLLEPKYLGRGNARCNIVRRIICLLKVQLYYIILYYIMLCYVILIILYYIILYYIILYYIILYVR